MTTPKGKYTIRYLPIAQQDLEEIFHYIKADRPSAALSLLTRFHEAISQLADYPQLGVLAKDQRLARIGYRSLVVDGYLVFYVIKKRTVQIRRVIHSARRYSFLLT